ncbi:MAG: 2,5-diamino-6-(ribosylamino)-4(3H)-pyrimidinone 5'-phosphate reductase [Peltula sp. TS41687]|nr:MAG: 2,5-diamino-6-(ribosylamino)-4(3H)-pyrimidinone 5'-phosphate reductase [Peltula sp. TS41687]
MAMSAAYPSLMPLETASELFSFLEPYLPPPKSSTAEAHREFPRLTLTYVSSLDGAITLVPGTHTTLSGPLSTAMAHYLRSRHDAILVGAGTAIVDDPALNCRLPGISYSDQPRPVILDPRGSWPVSMKSRAVQKAMDGSGKDVWWLHNDIFRGVALRPESREAVESGRVKIVPVPIVDGMGGRYQVVTWEDVLKRLAVQGIRSVMVEGGARVIKDLLSPRYRHLVSSVIITMAPVFLGEGSVHVRPDSERGEAGEVIYRMDSLEDVTWRGLGKDMVMCGRFSQPP